MEAEGVEIVLQDGPLVPDMSMAVVDTEDVEIIIIDTIPSSGLAGLVGQQNPIDTRAMLADAVAREANIGCRCSGLVGFLSHEISDDTEAIPADTVAKEANIGCRCSGWVGLVGHENPIDTRAMLADAVAKEASFGCPASGLVGLDEGPPRRGPGLGASSQQEPGKDSNKMNRSQGDGTEEKPSKVRRLEKV
ncbi:unnamed protein product [Symbiodinium sp. CCMP2592]|nr:unnamed protein product [Symbiodinium sp. CCMP2592]